VGNFKKNTLMEIKKDDLRVMRGPNYWSVTHQKLIVLTLDLEDFKDSDLLDTNYIESRLKDMFPMLVNYIEEVVDQYAASKSAPMFIATLVEVIARELQRLGGMESTYGRVEHTGQDRKYQVLFTYEAEDAGWYAAEAAVDIIQAIIDGEHYSIEEDIREIEYIMDESHPGPSTNAIITAAKRRDIPVREMADGAIIALGWGKYLKRIQGAVVESTSIIGVDIAGHKDDTKKLLEAAFIPVPKGKIVRSIEDLDEIVEDLGFPLVVKPLKGHQGKGITGNITKMWELEEAFERAQEHSREVIVEKYITGFDYRLLVIGYKFIAAAKRTPAAVTGDGRSTISELIKKVNNDPRRGSGHGKNLTRIVPDAITFEILKSCNLTLDSVLPEGKVLYLKDTANLSTGGTATDVTDEVHPDIVMLAERVARIVGLDICGIDIMATDLRVPLDQSGGAVLEVNAAPGLRMHIAPSEGTPRNVGDPIVDLMFPPGTNGRIPIVAITGTNGKTTTSRLMGHIAKTVGRMVGFTTTDGIYIDGKLIAKGDFTGPKSSEVVLSEPSVDFAVLECARGGMLRSGLAFDKCDVGIVTNVGEDHLGMKGINTIQDMARVKSVIPRVVHENGYAVLNADDDLVYNMRKEVRCRVALFSLDENNPRIREHCREGGLAATVHNGYITLLIGENKVMVEKVEDIPLTMGGKAPFNIQNVMAAVLAAHASNFDMALVARALKSFHPSAEQTPGRMNMFRFRDFDVMVDYAHNPPSMQALSQYLNNLDNHKVGIVTGVGDRRDEDMINIGKAAAEMFDEIIVRVDQDTRGRNPRDIVSLVSRGIRLVNKNVPIEVIPDETEAVITAVENARKGSLIVVATEKVERAINLIKDLQKQHDLQSRK
jgi:cyanophycin synthetase